MLYRIMCIKNSVREFFSFFVFFRSEFWGIKNVGEWLDIFSWFSDGILYFKHWLSDCVDSFVDYVHFWSNNRICWNNYLSTHRVHNRKSIILELNFVTVARRNGSLAKSRSTSSSTGTIDGAVFIPVTHVHWTWNIYYPHTILLNIPVQWR